MANVGSVRIAALERLPTQVRKGRRSGHSIDPPFRGPEAREFSLPPLFCVWGINWGTFGADWGTEFK